MPENVKETKPGNVLRIRDIIEVIVVAAIMVVIFNFLFDKDIVMSGSMEPTLPVGKQVLFLSSQIERSPEAGKILEFKHGDEMYCKRIIGLPGDTVEIKDNAVYVNGEKLNEDYLPEGTITEAGTSDIYVVPEGKLFVMGDNRENSYDSRYWDDPYVDISDVKGYYLFQF